MMLFAKAVSDITLLRPQCALQSLMNQTLDKDSVGMAAYHYTGE